MPDINEKSMPDLSAPHIRSGDSIRKIMWTVAAVLMIYAAYSVYIFGLYIFAVYSVCIASGIASEALFQFLMKRKIKISDGSSVITALLLAMSIPPYVPLWVAAAGTVFSVVVVKEFFGGIGFNIFNPALAGRAFVAASWPVYITASWNRFPSGSLFQSININPGGIPQGAVDVITQATPLAVLKGGGGILHEFNLPLNSVFEFFINNSIIKTLLFSNRGGCAGEVSAVLILIGALILIWRRIITWHVPVTFLGSVAILSYIYYSYHGVNPLNAVIINLLSGGLLLGAFFMATDMVTSPISPAGQMIFGAGCGVLTFALRIIGGYPEGVAYAILIMNAVVPLIDSVIRPSVFGLNRKRV